MDRFIAFTRRRNQELKWRILEARATGRGHTISLNIQATRWLEVYRNPGLQYKTHKNLTLEKARRAGNRVQCVTAARGLSLKLVQRIQVAAVQAVTLYCAEI